jgi:transposase
MQVLPDQDALRSADRKWKCTVCDDKVMLRQNAYGHTNSVKHLKAVREGVPGSAMEGPQPENRNQTEWCFVYDPKLAKKNEKEREKKEKEKEKARERSRQEYERGIAKGLASEWPRPKPHAGTRRIS